MKQKVLVCSVEIILKKKRELTAMLFFCFCKFIEINATCYVDNLIKCKGFFVSNLSKGELIKFINVRTFVKFLLCFLRHLGKSLRRYEKISKKYLYKQFEWLVC